MKKKSIRLSGWRLCLVLPLLAFLTTTKVSASSHREAPLITHDPLADNTDVYAFRSPNDSTKVTIIADYIPLELPEGGPNYYNFGPNIRYEVHIKNKTTTTVDDITYRFTFNQVNQDSTTFFNIRLGQQNLKTTYKCEKSIDGGVNFTTIIDSLTGTVPPANIGPRSIDSAVGLDTTYNQLIRDATVTLATGEKVFCGQADDPFFVDLGGIMDLGNFRPEGNSTNPPKDKLARFNVHSIVLQIPITLLQKDGKTTRQATSILDGDFVIGVWASASRQQIKTINGDGTKSYSGDWVQVSRLGMPLTNEAIIPIGLKDKWNTLTPYNSHDVAYDSLFNNPELALYMDTTKFARAVPALNELRIQTRSLGAFDFRNGKKGLFSLRNTPQVAGTAFAERANGGFADILLPDSMSPRAADLLPIFLTGVPNVRPYQLATGKNGDPLAAGKPFINNFLPTLGDMLRLNMAVPTTPRNDPNFSSLGIIKAAVLGLTDSTYTKSTALQFIPNMDGFPNGRRLEDDVTTIELQAVSGVALAAIGLWYDDYDPKDTTASPVTAQLNSVLGFTAGVTTNDAPFKTAFPYVQVPWRGFDYPIKPRF